MSHPSLSWKAMSVCLDDRHTTGLKPVRETWEKKRAQDSFLQLKYSTDNASLTKKSSRQKCQRRRVDGKDAKKRMVHLLLLS